MAVLLLLVIWALTVAGLYRVDIDTGIDAFVPRGDPTYKALIERDERFGSDPIVVAIEAERPEGFLLDAVQLPLLLGLEGKLANLAGVKAVYGPATVLNQTAKALQDMVAQISGQRDAIKEAVRHLARRQGATQSEARQAARLAVVRFDRRYGSLIAKALPRGLPTLRNQVFVGNVVFDDRGESRPQWRFLVPDTAKATLLVRPRAGLDQGELAAVIDQVRTAVDDSGLSIARTRIGGVPVVTTAVADEARTEIPVLGATALLVVAFILLLVPWTRHRSARARPILCALTGAGATIACFGWAHHPMSLGSVAFLPILFGVGSDYPLYLTGQVSRRVVAAVAAAGAAGFGSLALAGMPFVRELGIALACGVLITVSTAFLVNGALGQPRPGRTTTTTARKEIRPAIPALWSTWASGSRVVLRRQSNRATKRGGRVSLAAFALMASFAGWLALAAANVEASPEALAQGMPALEETQQLGADLGFAGEIDVAIRGHDVVDPAALRWAGEAESAIVREHGHSLTPVISLGRLLRFLGANPSSEQADAAADILPPYLMSSVTSSDRTWGVIVAGVSVTDVDDQKTLLRDVRETLPAAPAGFEAEVVGLPVVAARTLELVRADRLLLNLAGGFGAVLMLLILLPERRDAARAAGAVVLAGGWMFGLAVLVRGDLSPLTVAVGALVTVTACEFTVMLANARRRDAPSIRRSTITAALAGMAGYLVLLGSALSVLREFGALLACGVLLSLAAAQLMIVISPPPRDSARSREPAAQARQLLPMGIR